MSARSRRAPRAGGTLAPTRARAGISFVGAVLAGGQSRRMGRDKARLRVGGMALWRRQVDVLRAAGAAEVLVVRGPGQSGLRGPARLVRDRFAGRGPLAGIHGALVESSAPLLAVLAVDMVAVDPAWFVNLLGECRPGCGAVAKFADQFEPVAAVYPREALPEIVRRLERRELALHALVDALVRARRLRVVPVREEDRWQFENWNSPGDVARSV